MKNTCHLKLSVNTYHEINNNSSTEKILSVQSIALPFFATVNMTLSLGVKIYI